MQCFRGNGNKQKHGLCQEEANLVVEKRADVYRKSTLGRTLTSSLEHLMNEDKIGSNLRDVVLQQFDRTIARNLSHVPHNVVFMAENVLYYRRIDKSWKFKLQNAIFSEPDGELAHVDTCVVYTTVREDITL